jgi:RecB family endonuclease NucS
MPIFRLHDDAFVPLAETSFVAAGMRERADLQRRLRADVTLLSPDMMVIAEEFTDWEDSKRRIDLLCLDKDACLVVVELKRSEDAGHSELQAIRYAAMVSAMTFRQTVDAYAQHKRGDVKDAEAELLAFLGWDAPREEFGEDVKIVLVAADFSREVTTTALWLNERGIDIRCIRLKPYRLEDSTLIMDVQQVIPLPEAEDYLTKISDKRDEQRKGRSERHLLRREFWTGVLAEAKALGAPHGNRSPSDHGWIGSSGRGLNLNYAVRGFDGQAEIYIDRGTKEENLRSLEYLKAQHGAAEKIDGVLDWEPLPESRACRVRLLLKGGYRSPKSEWPQIQKSMATAGLSMERAFKDHMAAAAKA